MDIEIIERLANAVEQFSLTEIEYHSNGNRIRFVRTRDDATQRVRGQASLDGESLRACSEALRHVDNRIDGNGVNKPAHAPPGTQTVRAETSGIFYSAAAPGERPFVAVGDSVRQGQQIGIIEAMKTLLPLESDCDGIVSRLMVVDGEHVTATTPVIELAIGAHQHV